MDAKNIQKLVERIKDDVEKEVYDRLPRKVGVIAVNHFKQNFRDGGWLWLDEQEQCHFAAGGWLQVHPGSPHQKREYKC